MKTWGVLVCCFGLSLMPARADVYSDAVAWWHLDYDANTNGLVELAEAKDQLTWSAGGGYDATQVLGTPEWTTNTPAISAGGGRFYGGRALELTPVVVSNNVTADGLRIDNLSVTGDCSVGTRFYWNGSAGGHPSAWIYNNGFNYGPTNGFIFGVMSATVNPRLAIYHGQNGRSSSLTVESNVWYDAAVTIDDNGTNDVITFYLWEQDDSVAAALPALQKAFLNVGNFNGRVEAGRGTRIGYENETGTNVKAWDGTIDHIAVWDRALSELEVREAFALPGRSAFRVGCDNAGSGDLAEEAQLPNPANWSPGDPWHEMPRGVSAANDTVNVNFNLTADEASFDRVLRMDIHAAGSGGCEADFTLNGTSVHRRFFGAQARDIFVHVPAALLQTGTNTLTISHRGGSWVRWDSLDLGWSWQIGVDDNNQMEFRQEAPVANDFHVNGRYYRRCGRAMTAGNNTLSLHFSLPDLYRKYNEGGYYTGRIIKQTIRIPGGNELELYLNGALIQSYAAIPDKTDISEYLPKSLLQPGDNILQWKFLEADGWSQFDFHRFSLAPPVLGSVFIVK